MFARGASWISSQVGRASQAEQRLAGMWAALLATAACLVVPALVAAVAGAPR